MAAARIEAGALSADGGLEGLAAELGIGTRQLRRVTKQYLGVSPVEIAQTHRLLMAKQLLTETRLPMIDVALVSGFSSVRRFNALFRDHYRLTPRGLRRNENGRVDGEPLRLSLAYRPPLAWRELLAFLAPAIPGVELVDGAAYLRTVALGEQTGWVRVEPRRNRATLVVEVSSSLLRRLPEVMAGLRNLFDLTARPDIIAATLVKDVRLRSAVRRRPGLRVPGAFDGFELAVRAILGQQMSVRTATTLAGRLAAKFGTSIETPFHELHRLTPSAAALADASAAQIARIGMPARRAQTLCDLARAVERRQVSLVPGAAPLDCIERLLTIAGIGDWTAQYVAMRALRWPDAFPAGDLALKRWLGGSEKRARDAAEAWRPWRAYGAMHSWMMQAK